MPRAAMVSALFVLVGASGAAAQEPTPPAHVYEAFYRVSFADLEEWNRQYLKYSVPILQSMQGEGKIEGFGQYEHNTGGEYNLRFVVRTHDWAALGDFWGEYLERLEAATPAAELQAGAGMIQAHRDEIWDIGEINTTNAPTNYMYASTFRYNFRDEEEWNRIWSDVVGPILAVAIEEGILGGWVKLNHNTGGPHNSKVLYFFEEWDDIDDLFAKLLTEMGQNPEGAKSFGMFRAHDDVIWVPTATGN